MSSTSKRQARPRHDGYWVSPKLQAREIRAVWSDGLRSSRNAEHRARLRGWVDRAEVVRDGVRLGAVVIGADVGLVGAVILKDGGESGGELFHGCSPHVSGSLAAFQPRTSRTL